MPGSFLESTLLLACPSFRPEWDALRRAHPPNDAGGGGPSAADFLTALEAHVLNFLVEGRAAEFARVMRTVERLLGEADPILEELLADRFVTPLAASARALDLPLSLSAPHLGPRTRRLWNRATA